MSSVGWRKWLKFKGSGFTRLAVGSPLGLAQVASGCILTSAAWPGSGFGLSKSEPGPKAKAHGSGQVKPRLALQ